MKSFLHTSAPVAAAGLGSYLRRHRIRVAHSFDIPANIVLPPVARMARVPVVLSSQRASRELTPKRYSSLVKVSDRLVDGIVVNCLAMKKHMIDDAGISPSRLHLCYNGIDTRIFRRAAGPKPPELSGASLVVGIVCALRPEKDLPTLVRAFAIARRGHPGMRLLIVGSGPMRESLERLSSELAIAECCVFVPSTADVVRWLSVIDVFVLPSKFEALSNSLMEAMACECAPVVSDVGGNPELVADGERGLIFHAGNSEELAARLTILAANADLRHQYAEAGCRFIRGGFSVEKSRQRMSEIYREMNAETRVPGAESE